MRVAVFSDVHGNAVALAAVLDDIARLGADRVLCGGDLAFGGPEPEACVARIRQAAVPCVRGNTDEWLGPDSPGTAGGLAAWTRAQLSADSRRYLAGLPFSHRLDDLVVVHATPWSITDAVFPGAGEAVLRRILVEVAAAAVVYGHVHQGWIGEVPGVGLVVNSGSVGFPYDGDPRASYAVLQRGPQGWMAELRRVAYDVDGAAAAFPPDHPAADAWAAMMRTGRRAGAAG